MSDSTIDRKLDQLDRLYALREQLALEAIAEQRKELERVLDRLAEQQSLIKSLEDQLEVLHQLRDGTAIRDLTVESLRAESERRKMLSKELEMEVFYLGGFESDVRDARLEMAQRQRRWRRVRDQLKGLERLHKKQRSQKLLIQNRRDDAALDDRRRVL